MLEFIDSQNITYLHQKTALKQGLHMCLSTSEEIKVLQML